MSMRWMVATAVLLRVGSAQAFEVFHSRTDAPADRVPGVVRSAAGVTDLNVWIDTLEGGVGNADPGVPELACSGPGSSGDYSCAWDLQFTSTGDIEITGFTPQKGGDYIVMHQPDPTHLRMNGGNPAGNPAGELDEVRIGTLHVRANGPNGQVLLSQGSSVDTQYGLVPAAGTPTLLANACAPGGALDADCDGLQGAEDNCPYYAQTVSTDTDGDGRGDECECGDVNRDGGNTVVDLVEINRCIFAPAPKPQSCLDYCDSDGDNLCNVNDIIAANIEIYSPANTSRCVRQPVAGP